MLVEGVLGGVAGLVRHPQPFMRLMVSFFLGGQLLCHVVAGMEGFSQGSGLASFCPCFVKAAGAPVSPCSVGKREVRWGALVPLCLFAVTSEMGKFSLPPPHPARLG